MPVLEVQFDGDTEELQDELDDADLEAEVDVQGDAPAGGGAGGEEQGGGTPIGTRTAFVGVVTAIVGLLVPIKEILEGIQNFFLVTLAPVFTALRPLIDTVRKIILSISRFLAGDISLEDIADTIVESIQGLFGDLIGDFSVNTPFGNITLGDTQQPSREGTRSSQEERQTIQRVALNNPGVIAGRAAGNFVKNNYFADRTDEAEKERQSNAVGNTDKTSLGTFNQTISRIS